MPELQTEVLRVETDKELFEALPELRCNLQVGGILLPEYSSAEIRQDLLAEDRRNNTKLVKYPEFQLLFSKLAQYVAMTDRYKATDMGGFRNGHDWHLSETNVSEVSIRTWTHVRGEVELWLARSADLGVRGGYGFDDQYVDKNSYAKPAVVKADPGDTVLFIDFACVGRSGTSTFHKGEVPTYEQNRLSVACEVAVPHN